MYAGEQTALRSKNSVSTRKGPPLNQLAIRARHTPRQNDLLAGLPAADYARLSDGLELVPMPLGRAVYESGGPLDYAYFPTDCIVSLLSVTRDGSSAEIAVAGSEGLVGIALFMGGETISSRAVVQNAGHAYRVPAPLIKEEFDRGGALQSSLLRYTQALMTQMAQTAVCNRHHSLEQQLCRWLLLSLDRLPSNRLQMTEALIADMLGVPREGAAAAAGMLQTQGLIRYHDGAITVLDRARLEQRVCECYAVVKRESDRLFALPVWDEALRLSGFIEHNLDAIVARWGASAHALLPAAEMAGALRGIARDLRTGTGGARPHDGVTRSLSLVQLGREYQALRASVIKLWRTRLPTEHQAAVDDLARFDESVGQALAQAIARHENEAVRSRDTFLAILGHDLRSPLSAVSMSGHCLATGTLAAEQQRQAVDRIRRGAAKMESMISDLLAFAKTRLGREMPMARKACSIGGLCEAALEEMKAGNPGRAFRLEASGDLGGSYDSARLQQAFGNLLNNAVQHGAKDSPVVVEAHGGPDAVTVKFRNQGLPIAAGTLQEIFDPLVQGSSPASGPHDRLSTSLGFGLFIARSIVAAHGGTLEVESSDASGTVFTARFPRGGAAS